jgi:glycosyltransferase involved in cell wall biosynthesis
MRIGIVTGEYPPLRGGVGAYSRIIAKTLVSQGHEVFIFGNTDAHEDDPNIHLTRSVKKWRWGSLRMVNHWTKANRLDVVNLQYQTAAYDMSPWIHFMPSILQDIPFVTTFHDLLFPYLFPKAGWLRSRIVMRLANASTGAIVTNHEDIQRLQHLSHKMLIPIGSNILTLLPDNFNRQRWRTNGGASANDFLLAHFGFVNRSKGLETLLEALATLRNDGHTVKLLMIGGRTGSSDPTNIAYVKEIDTLITELNLDEHIHWTGFVDDTTVTTYLAASDAIVLPFRDGASYRRGSLMAAIQHQCAIITTQPQVEISTFKHQENMLLFPPGNTQALIDTIKHAIANVNTLKQLRKGTHELNQNFDWENITQKTVRFFEQLPGHHT